MHWHQVLSGRQRQLFRLILFLFALFVLFRLGFYFHFNDQVGEFKTSILLKGLYLGFKFDLRVVALFVFPFFFLIHLRPLDLTRNRLALWGWQFLYLMVAGLITALMMLDWGYYDYLNDRLNATVLQFAENLAISFEMIWETYPIVWLVLGFCLYLIGLHYILRKFVLIDRMEVVDPRSRKLRWGSNVVVFFLLAGAVYGKLAYYPLRWSEAYFSGHRFIAALSLNPIHNFVDTLDNRTKNFEIDKVKASYDIVSRFLGVTEPDKENLSFRRIQKPTPHPQLTRRPNIVVIIMESLSAHRMGAFGNEANATPTMDRLADGGWLFKNFYTPSEGTARGIFALVTGLTDINKGRTSSRNPMIVDQNTAANYLLGYEKYYFIGGSANWGNIRGFLTNNIVGLKLYEEGMFESPRTDVWGISDYHLFIESKKILDERDASKPYLAFIQTAGFHRPYSIPEDHGSFQLAQPDAESLKVNGFKHAKEYNSLRFMDYSLGYFMEQIKNDPQFENTLFVILGDHGLPDNKSQNLTPTMSKFGIERFHTPLIFYAPKLLQKKQFERIISQQDIFPTLAGLTGHHYINKGLGRNVFDPAFKNKDYTFSYVYYRNPHKLFLFGRDFLVTGTPGNIEGLYNYRSLEKPMDIKAQFPDQFQNMSDLLLGLYETSKYLLYNNKKEIPDSNNQPK